MFICSKGMKLFQLSKITIYYVTQLANRNTLLKDQVERLKIENLAFQDKHDMLLCSHENLMDDHIKLNIAHEVVVTNLKSQQPHSCTCVQIETILPSRAQGRK
jgi:5'(3')-deoxyribonucleotidase